MKVNSQIDNSGYKQSFNASFKLTDPGNLVPKALLKEYTQRYAALGTASDKVTIAIKEVECSKNGDQLQFSVGVSKDGDFDVFSDNINLWIYGAREVAERQLRNVFETVSKMFT